MIPGQPARAGAVLVLGATSAIGRAVAQEFAAAGHDLILAGRDPQETARSAADLRVRHGVKVVVREFDAEAFDSHARFFEFCVNEVSGGLQGVVLCHGYMAEQADAQRDFELARRMIDVNYTSAVSILNLAANYFEQRRGGFIAAVSSVAGDRGRQSNYLYGSTKAALSTYLQGLRNRLSKAGVCVLTVKPGFVDTAMTYGRPGMFLVAAPQRVARDIFRGVHKHKDVIYTPWFWWGIMSIIKSVPERIFKKGKL